MTIKTLERVTVKNDEIAASGTELTLSGTQRVDFYNSLLVQNSDANSNIEVRLNDVDAASPSERFFIEKNFGFLNFGPDAGIHFNRVFIVNLDSGNVVADDAVLIRASRIFDTEAPDSELVFDSNPVGLG